MPLPDRVPPLHRVWQGQDAFRNIPAVADVRDARSRAESAIDRIAREGRKYGLCLVVVSQTHRDFAYDAACSPRAALETSPRFGPKSRASATCREKVKR